MGIAQILLATGSSGGGFSPVTNTYTASQTITIPTGATHAQIELYGSGAGGGLGGTGGHSGGGGGSGGLVQTTLAVTGGATLSLTIGNGGGSQQSGFVSSLSSGTQALPTMTANGGNVGSDGSVSANGSPGTGGTATGGNVGNTTGTTGTGTGGALGLTGALGTGNRGGNGGSSPSNPGASGGNGQCIIQFT